MSAPQDQARTVSEQDDVIALMKNARLSLPIGRAPDQHRSIRHFLPKPVRLMRKLLRPVALLGFSSGIILGHVGVAVIDHHFGVSIDAAIPDRGGPVIQGGATSAWGRGVGLDETLAESRPTLIKLTEISSTMAQRGASSEQIARLLYRMAEASSVTVFGRPDKALEHQDAKARIQNLEILQRLWAARHDAAQWTALHKALAKEEGDRSLGVFYFGNDRNLKQREDSIGVQMAYDIPSAIYFSSWVDDQWLGHKVSESRNDTDLAHARTNLAQAVHDVGLAAWKVPAVRWARADLLNQDAKNLRSANQELEQITGWQGGVLGLNNRVIVNNNSRGDGKTSAALDGQHTLILSDWTSLGHEWFHALDDTLGKSGAVWRWRSAQISGWSQTGLKPPEAGREDWLASSWWSAAAGWGRRVALITEGNYSPANDRRNQVAQQAVQTLWVGLAEPSLSATQRARILEVLRIRREELVGLRTEKRTNTIHKEPSGAISGENLIFNRSRAALASTPVERLGSAQGMSSPWFNLRARTRGKIEQAISQVSLSLMPHGYRFDKDAVVDYVTDPTEMLAYAFSAQVALQGAKVGAKPILVDPEIAHDRKPEWNMTQSEAQVHTGAWTAFFKTLGPWWEQDRTQRMGPTATTVVESKNIDAVVSKPRAATTAAARQMADAQVTPKRRRGP